MEDKVRQAKKRKREVKAFEFALNQINDASISSLENLNRLKTQLLKNRNSSSLEPVRIGISNEVKKLNNISKDLENLKNQIPEDELGIFYVKIELLRNRLHNEVESIINVMDFSPSKALQNETVNNESEVHQDLLKTNVHGDNIDLASEVAAKRAVYQDWEVIRSDLTCLNEMFNSLATSVMEQGETVLKVDCTVQEANDKIRDGARILQKIKKNAALPLLGAAVGTCIAGPVGMIAGFKIGAISCLATGTLGYFSGKAVQTRVNNLPTIDMIEDTHSSPTSNSNEDEHSEDPTCDTINVK